MPVKCELASHRTYSLFTVTYNLIIWFKILRLCLRMTYKMHRRYVSLINEAHYIPLSANSFRGKYDILLRGRSQTGTQLSLLNWESGAI